MNLSSLGPRTGSRSAQSERRLEAALDSERPSQPRERRREEFRLQAPTRNGLAIPQWLLIHEWRLSPLTAICNVYTFIQMDVTFEFQGQVFEWDSKKASTNLRKHHVSFEKACEVLFDPFVCMVDASDQGEAREAAIGLTEDWALLFVVLVERQEDAIRIISARRATPLERREYEHE